MLKIPPEAGERGTGGEVRYILWNLFLSKIVATKMGKTKTSNFEP